MAEGFVFETADDGNAEHENASWDVHASSSARNTAALRGILSMMGNDTAAALKFYKRRQQELAALTQLVEGSLSSDYNGMGDGGGCEACPSGLKKKAKKK